MDALFGGLIMLFMYGLAVLVLYAVVRRAVHHGIRDADRERREDQSR
ncbi:hypothetical protein [Micromonospora radicis]|nr:hypothetical protein [Micromonospora radicis]